MMTFLDFSFNLVVTYSCKIGFILIDDFLCGGNWDDPVDGCFLFNIFEFSCKILAVSKKKYPLVNVVVQKLQRLCSLLIPCLKIEYVRVALAAEM